jgi:hypothetical protein
MDEPVLSLKGGGEFMAKSAYKGGTIYLSASPLDKAYCRPTGPCDFCPDAL